MVQAKMWRFFYSTKFLSTACTRLQQPTASYGTFRFPCWTSRVSRHFVSFRRHLHADRLPWSPPDQEQSANTSPPQPFAECYFEDDNILSFYAIQRVALSPQVDENVVLKSGLQHLDIKWKIGSTTYVGHGVGTNKKAARREAAHELLRHVPVHDDVAGQMRKQMLNMLRMRLKASVVSNCPIAPRQSNGKHVHRIIWRVSSVGNGVPIELSADGSGGSPEAAHENACEKLYLAAMQRKLHSPQKIAKEALEDASKGRKAQVQETLTALSDDAAAELATRHNYIVNRHKIQSEVTTTEHKEGFHCTLNWLLQTAHGGEKVRTTTALGSSKRTARGNAIHEMLVKEGFAENLSVETLNNAARIRALVTAFSSEAFKAAIGFVEVLPPAAWSLFLPEVWNLALAKDDLTAISALGGALQRSFIWQISQDSSQEVKAGSKSNGMPPQLWEQMLDSCARVASRETASQGMLAIANIPVNSNAFISSVHCEYFHHYRRLLAWERVGNNQASIAEIEELGDARKCLIMDIDQCILPYLTLRADTDDIAALEMADIRADDVVYVQATGLATRSGRNGHLARVIKLSTSGVKGGKLSLRCDTLSAADLDAQQFAVHRLDSEVTALRWTSALRALVQPILPIGEQGKDEPPTFDPAVRDLLLKSFHAEGVESARILSETRAAGSWPPQQELERLIQLTHSFADKQGFELTEAQTKAVSSALSQRLTLIHGPPGTGKTFAAACVVFAWRQSGQRILCAADSNVAADRLHALLEKWGLKALRFPLASESLDMAGKGQSIDRLGGGAAGDSGYGRRARRNRFSKESQDMYQRLLALRRAVHDFQIVVTTCGSAGHELLKDSHFPRLIVDECTQSVELATLVPLSHGSSHVVLIGDHRQLPPTVMDEQARRGGLEKSLFARLAEEVVDTAGEAGAVANPILLDRQRRMHPSIAAFPNQHFYDGHIQNDVQDRPPIPGVTWPQNHEVRVLLVDVAPVDGEQQTGFSFSNLAEADAILDLITHIVQSSMGGAPGISVSPGQIAVLTPYMQQKRLLQDEFQKRVTNSTTAFSASSLANVRVSTVDGFQGAEADLVLLSTVRSNSRGRLGFLADVRRANVLLTRARRGLIVFADSSTMHLASGSVWAEWLTWVREKQAVVSLAALRESMRSDSVRTRLGV